MKTYIHENLNSILLNPNNSDFEVVERKFRGHPDSMADMVSQSFTHAHHHDLIMQVPLWYGIL